MAENKTQKNEQRVAGFLDGVDDERKRADSRKIVEHLESANAE